LRAADCPRYMNVPSPAPCHANVAGVGKQSVWGLRIIACSSISTVTSFPEFVNSPKIGYALSMSAGSVTVSSGQFFGDRFRTVATDSFVCSEGDATCPAREVHRHASSHFVLVVKGMYITEARNQDRLYGPGTLIYNPTGTTHRDRFHMGRGSFLTIIG